MAPGELSKGNAFFSFLSYFSLGGPRGVGVSINRESKFVFNVREMHY